MDEYDNLRQMYISGVSYVSSYIRALFAGERWDFKPIQTNNFTEFDCILTLLEDPWIIRQMLEYSTYNNIALYKNMGMKKMLKEWVYLKKIHATVVESIRQGWFRIRDDKHGEVFTALLVNTLQTLDKGDRIICIQACIYGNVHAIAVLQKTPHTPKRSSLRRFSYTMMTRLKHSFVTSFASV